MDGYGGLDSFYGRFYSDSPYGKSAPDDGGHPPLPYQSECSEAGKKKEQIQLLNFLNCHTLRRNLCREKFMIYSLDD